MKNPRKIFKNLFLFSTLFIHNSCERNVPENEKQYVYEGKVELFCGGLIYVQQEEVNFIKPVNLEDKYLQQDLNVRVTFTYMGETENSCGGFVGNPKKVKIIHIIKL